MTVKGISLSLFEQNNKIRTDVSKLQKYYIYCFCFILIIPFQRCGTEFTGFRTYRGVKRHASQIAVPNSDFELHCTISVCIIH